jgi:2-hydroxy-3-keto-5-methylthiopentenyl-1-phosphate phosphatase
VRFARDGLAAWLDEQGVRYERFDDLDDVRAALDATRKGDAGDGRGG